MSSLIPNLTDFEIYADLYEEQTITISSSSNSSGSIDVDDNGNSLNIIISNGRRNIFECSALESNMILYDDTNFVYIDSTFSSVDIDKRFLIKQMNNLKYYLDSDREEPSSVDGDVLTIDLTDKSIFKIFINGNEVTSYTSNSSSITITGTDTDYITGTNDFIIVYTYLTSQIVSGTTTLKFKGANTIVPDYNDLSDGSFFTDTVGLCDRFDDNLSISEAKTFGSLDRTFEYTIEKDELNRELKINFVQFGEEIRNELRKENFRILAWGEDCNCLYILNNCYWNDGANNNFQKSRNELTLSFDCEEILLIEYEETTVYGSGVYGTGTYGGYKQYNLTDVVS